MIDPQTLEKIKQSCDTYIIVTGDNFEKEVILTVNFHGKFVNVVDIWLAIREDIPRKLQEKMRDSDDPRELKL